MKLLVISTLVALCSSLNIRYVDHTYSMDTSQVIANGIKQVLLNNLSMFTNKEFRDQLEKDLKQSDDSKRKLKSIDIISAQQLFSIVKVQNPNCDENGDYKIQGDELKCLNIIWKAFLPQ